MNINVLNRQFEKIAVIDTYTSLMWCKRYYDVGALDLQIEASKENLNIFRKDYYITRDNDDAVFRIEAIEIAEAEEGDSLIIGAVDCKEILSQRITWSQVFVRNCTVEEFIKQLLNTQLINPSDSKRKIRNFRETVPVLTTERSTRQSTYDDVGEKVIELCRENELGCKMSLDEDNYFVFTMYRGTDRSISQRENPRIIFEPNFENLFSSDYKFDQTNLKNVALVGGEGEGVERKLRSVGDAEGLERREMFVDAGSASSEEGGDLVEYYKALVNEGKTALAETTNVASFEGEVDAQNSYRYKTDYDLGDIVTVRNKYGISADARIVEVVETWDESGYSIEPVFEYVSDEVTILDAILTEDRDPLMTENGEILTFEFSPLVTEDETNYIITEDDEHIISED